MKKILLLLSLTIVFATCKKDKKADEVQTNDSVTENKLKDKVIVVNSTDILSLSAIDSASLTFDASSTLASNAQIGTVLVSDISTLTPYGFLRKVTSKSNVGGKIQLQTTDASLDDLFKQCDIHYSKGITPADTTGRISSTEFTINLVDEVLYDADGNNSTTYDQLKSSGSIVFELKDFSFDYVRTEGSTLPSKVEIKAQVLDKSNLTCSFGGSVSIPNKILKLVKSYEIFPIRIIVPVAGVPVPVIFKNKLKISPAFKAEGKFQITYTDNTLFTVGAKYEGSWTPINTSTPLGGSSTPSKTKFNWKVNADVKMNIEVESKPYGSNILKSTIGCDYGLKMYVDTTLNPDYKFYTGGEFKASIKSDFFGKNLFDFNYSYDFPEVLFFQGNFSDTYLTANLNGLPYSGKQPIALVFVGHDSIHNYYEYAILDSIYSNDSLDLAKAVLLLNFETSNIIQIQTYQSILWEHSGGGGAQIGYIDSLGIDVHGGGNHTISITSYDGNYIEGNFSGTLATGFSVTNGSFRAKKY